MNQKVATRLKLTNSVSPRTLDKTSNLGEIRYDKFKTKKIKSNLNKEFKANRIKSIKNRRFTESNLSTKTKTSIRRNDKTPATQISSAQVTSKFNIMPNSQKAGIEQTPKKSKISDLNSIENEILSESYNNTDYKGNTDNTINGYSKHISRNLFKESAKSGDHAKVVKQRKKRKSRNIENKSNIKIINNSYDKLDPKNDYLLQKRIEREINPERFVKRSNKWNMSLREDCTDDDYYMMHFKAQQVARKALIKESYILESFDEKEKMERNNEIDKMLINSLKAKIKLINDL